MRKDCCQRFCLLRCTTALRAIIYPSATAFFCVGTFVPPRFFPWVGNAPELKLAELCFELCLRLGLACKTPPFKTSEPIVLARSRTLFGAVVSGTMRIQALCAMVCFIVVSNRWRRKCRALLTNLARWVHTFFAAHSVVPTSAVEKLLQIDRGIADETLDFGAGRALV